LAAELVTVVAAVGPELPWATTAAEQLVNQRQQMPPFVLVPRADPDRKRGAGGVNC
jgi:hypothetical protein